MGYSEPVAAGIMGNIMRECGGDTLSGLDPSAQNSYGNGHYGIIQDGFKVMNLIHMLETIKLVFHMKSSYK